MIALDQPPKFLGQAGPQTPADWVSLQRWFTEVYNAIEAQNQVNHAFSLNISYDAAGTTDTRPDTWGTAAYVDVPLQFLEVPAGKSVALQRAYGTHQAWAQNPSGAVSPIPNGSNAGVLFGILFASSADSPYVTAGLAQSGCCIYTQNQCGPYGCLTPFDYDLSQNEQAVLGTDNTLKIRLAMFLNNTGESIHQEVSLVLEFVYE